MDLFTIENIKTLAGLTFEFGPFALAIILLAVILFKDLTSEQRWLLNACFALTIVSSVGFWIYDRLRGNHMYHVKIVGLQDQQRMGDEYLMKERTRHAPDQSTIRDYEFLVLREKPFRHGDAIQFNLYRVPPPPPLPKECQNLAAAVPGVLSVSAKVVYEGRDKDEFDLDWPAAGTPRLVWRKQ